MKHSGKNHRGNVWKEKQDKEGEREGEGQGGGQGEGLALHNQKGLTSQKPS